MYINLSVRHYFSSLCCGLLILLFSLSGYVHASSLVEPDTAKVAVADHSAKARSQAQKEALRQVFIKMSGTPSVLSNEQVRRAVNNASDYLVAYRYSQPQDTLFYNASFAKEALDAILRQEQLPRWGTRRPDTLFWLAVEQQNQRWILRENQPEPLGVALNEAAARRGIPVALPLMDLTDNTNIGISDVWGQFGRVLRKASSRYTPDFILSARLFEKGSSAETQGLSTEQKLEQALAASNLMFETQAENNDETNNTDASVADDITHTMPKLHGEGQYTLEWVLLENGASQYGTIRADSPQASVTQLMEQYADYLAKRFSVRFNKEGTSDNALIVSVANLDSLTHYVHAQEFLSQLSVVDSAVLTKQNGSVATFSLQLMGNRNDFFNALSFESKLRPVTDSFGQALEGNNFYWNE